jgi:hypothetical protein
VEPSLRALSSREDEDWVGIHVVRDHSPREERQKKGAAQWKNLNRMCPFTLTEIVAIAHLMITMIIMNEEK